VADALTQLKERFARITDLERISRVLSWDQQTMMPPAGWRHRGEHLATLRRIHHEALTADEIGRLLDEAGDLDPETDDGAFIRVARRDHEKAVQVPAELRAEMTRLSTEARTIWVKARADSNFELFRPALERTYDLRSQYVDCFGPIEEPYDILLDDFEPETTTAEVTEVFAELKSELVPLIAELRDEQVDDSFLTGTFPIDAQERLAKEVGGAVRVPERHVAARPDGASVRLGRRCRRHPDNDALRPGDDEVVLLDDARVRPRALLAAAAPPPRAAADRRPVLARHSRVAEPDVGEPRRPQRAVLAVLLPRAQEAFPEQLRSVELDRFLAGINRVKPSLIRIKADEVTYGMHVILRFELEQDLVNGRSRSPTCRRSGTSG
jgi:carboxypeptidase Taq